MNVKPLLCLFISMCSFACQAMVTAWQPFEINDGRIMVRSKVEGIAGYTLVDSSIKLNKLNQQFIDSHNLDIKLGAQ